MLSKLLILFVLVFWSKCLADVGNEEDIWSASNSPSKSWTSIAMSTTGQLAAAATSNGPIYLSNDNGINWSQSSAPTERNGWLQIVSSHNGQYLAAITNDGAGNSIYLSANFGGSWTQAVTPNVYQWLCIASSASGQILVAGTAQSGTQAGGGIYISKDYGMSFTQTSAPSSNMYWASITMSANGSFIFGSQLTYSGGSTGLPSYIYRSLNGGDTWVQTSLPLVGSGFLFGALASDYESQFLYTVVSDLTLYLGFNYGESWTVLTVSTTPWKSLACSGDGKYVAATTTDAVHLSETFGVTWNAQTITTTGGVGWAPVAVNGSGLFKLAGQADNGLIYRGFYNTTYNHSAVTTSSDVPSYTPSALPSMEPSLSPSISPTVMPSAIPTAETSFGPSIISSIMPSANPTFEIVSGSHSPSASPTTGLSTDTPTINPTINPITEPSTVPSVIAESSYPIIIPTESPSMTPTASPSFRPSLLPTTENNNNATSSSTSSKSNYGLGTTDEFALIIVFCITALFLLGLGGYFLRKYLLSRQDGDSNEVDAWSQNAIRRSEMELNHRKAATTVQPKAVAVDVINPIRSEV